MTKAIIFDMDGVLIDSEPIRLEHVLGILKNLGVTMSNEEYIKFIGTTSHYLWGTIKDRYSLSNEVEELISIDRNEYFKYISSSATVKTPINGIPELVKSLYENNYKMAVASSSPISVIEIIAESTNLKGYFNELVTGDYVKRSKPEPDIFLYAAEKLGVLPEECVVIEDSCNGVRAAKKAGMKCIAYRNFNSGNQDLSKADIIINSFYDLICLDLNNITRLVQLIGKY
jgi:HAD superfamily hydrolase (TIGR01509 family)